MRNLAIWTFLALIFLSCSSKIIEKHETDVKTHLPYKLPEFYITAE